MTTETKIARRKLSLLQLAAELTNVSKACKIMGYSRQQFFARSAAITKFMGPKASLIGFLGPEARTPIASMRPPKRPF